jgi:hypothetical protein
LSEDVTSSENGTERLGLNYEYMGERSAFSLRIFEKD